MIAAHQDRTRPDLHALADDAIRSDMRAGIHLRGGRDPGAGIDARPDIRRAGKNSGRILAKAIRGLVTRITTFREEVKRPETEDGRGLALLRGQELRRLFRKGEIAGPGSFDRGQPGQPRGSIAQHFAIDDPGNFKGSEGNQRKKWE